MRFFDYLNVKENNNKSMAKDLLSLAQILSCRFLLH